MLRTERERVLIQSGVAAGERVCLSILQAPVDGMLVRTSEVQDTAAERAR